jgi:hypothetical protein
MRRWLSLSIMAVLLTATAAPLLACLAPDASAAAQSCGCCKHMRGTDSPSQSMSCCEVSKQPNDFPAAVTDRQITPPPQIVFAPLLSTAVQTSDLFPIAQTSFATAPPPSASVLRI